MKKRQPTIGDRICEVSVAIGTKKANEALKQGWRIWGPGVALPDGLIAFTMVKLVPLPEDDEE